MKENLKEQILNEAKHQIINNGYSKTTIRSVASACDIGVGTMYNYFRSKDELIASFMLDDWRKCVLRMEESACPEEELFLKGVHEALSDFITKYHSLFHDEDAIKAFASVFSSRHIQFRQRIAKVISPITERSDFEDKMFLAEHIAESIINWSMEGVAFKKQYSIIQKIL